MFHLVPFDTSSHSGLRRKKKRERHSSGCGQPDKSLVDFEHSSEVVPTNKRRKTEPMGDYEDVRKKHKLLAKHHTLAEDTGSSLNVVHRSEFVSEDLVTDFASPKRKPKKKRKKHQNHNEQVDSNKEEAGDFLSPSVFDSIDQNLSQDTDVKLKQKAEFVSEDFVTDFVSPKRKPKKKRKKHQNHNEQVDSNKEEAGDFLSQSVSDSIDQNLNQDSDAKLKQKAEFVSENLVTDFVSPKRKPKKKRKKHQNHNEQVDSNKEEAGDFLSQSVSDSIDQNLNQDSDAKLKQKAEFVSENLVTDFVSPKRKPKKKRKKHQNHNEQVDTNKEEAGDFLSHSQNVSDSIDQNLNQDTDVKLKQKSRENEQNRVKLLNFSENLVERFDVDNFHSKTLSHDDVITDSKHKCRKKRKSAIKPFDSKEDEVESCVINSILSQSVSDDNDQIPGLRTDFVQSQGSTKKERKKQPIIVVEALLRHEDAVENSVKNDFLSQSVSAVIDQNLDLGTDHIQSQGRSKETHKKQTIVVEALLRHEDEVENSVANDFLSQSVSTVIDQDLNLGADLVQSQDRSKEKQKKKKQRVVEQLSYNKEDEVESYVENNLLSQSMSAVIDQNRDLGTDHIQSQGGLKETQKRQPIVVEPLGYEEDEVENSVANDFLSQSVSTVIDQDLTLGADLVQSQDRSNEKRKKKKQRVVEQLSYNKEYEVESCVENDLLSQSVSAVIDQNRDLSTETQKKQPIVVEPLSYEEEEVNNCAESDFLSQSVSNITEQDLVQSQGRSKKKREKRLIVVEAMDHKEEEGDSYAANDFLSPSVLGDRDLETTPKKKLKKKQSREHFNSREDEVQHGSRKELESFNEENVGSSDLLLQCVPKEHLEATDSVSFAKDSNDAEASDADIFSGDDAELVRISSVADVCSGDDAQSHLNLLGSENIKVKKKKKKKNRQHKLHSNDCESSSGTAESKKCKKKVTPDTSLIRNSNSGTGETSDSVRIDHNGSSKTKALKEKSEARTLKDEMENNEDYDLKQLHRINRLAYLKYPKDRAKDGIRSRTGRWFNEEDEQLRENWNEIIQDFNITAPHFLLMTRQCADIETRRQVTEYIATSDFYIRLANAIPRTLFDVYVRARKIFDPKHKLGKFSKEEESQLLELHEDFGNQWNKIGEIMGRSSASCSDTFRKIKTTQYRKGDWEIEEEERLIHAVQEHMKELGADKFDKLPWTAIAKSVGTRNWNQCMKQWMHTATKPLRKMNRKMRVRLIALVNQSCGNATFECDIDWKKLWEEHFQEYLSSPVKLKECFAHLRRYYVPAKRMRDEPLHEFIEYMVDGVGPYLVNTLRASSKVKEELLENLASTSQSSQKTPSTPLPGPSQVVSRHKSGRVSSVSVDDSPQTSSATPSNSKSPKKSSKRSRLKSESELLDGRDGL